MKQFWFDGVGSASMGMAISGSGVYNAPERDVTLISIPGRNGDLIQDNGRFKNITVSYPVSICSDFAAHAAAIRAWLLSGTGYKRLEDDYDPDHYRLALCAGGVAFTPGQLNRTGETVINFNCKPQRFLKAGEFPVAVAHQGALWNPTCFPAQPMITIYGTGPGVLGIGAYAVSITDLAESLVLDCQSLDAYRVEADGSWSNQNRCVVLDPDFPVLEPGENQITFDGGIAAVEIVPRWWTL